MQRTHRAAAARWALAVASGILLTLLYPPFDLQPLGWVALTPLLVALRGARPRTGLGLGWLTGTVLSLGVTGYWMFRAARDYFALSPLVAAAFTVGANQLFVSIYFAVFGLGVTWLSGRRGRTLLIAALFVATEYARAHVLSGNPWTLLGHSQTAPALMQICDLTGVYGLSFLLAMAAAATAEVRRRRVPLVLTAIAVAATCAYGAWRLATVRPTGALAVELVQANVSNDERGQPRFFAAHVRRYLDLTRPINPPPALIVWPENAIGFFPQDNPELLAPIVDALRDHDAALLFGAPRSAGAAGVAAIYNAAYLLTAAGFANVYDKQVLLPFVERLPLRPGDGPYLPGTEATIFTVAGTRFGVLICYEALYAERARELVARGAQLLINISNDSWFEAGAGPEQHYLSARFRAVENRVSLVRVTNSGISGVIDPLGREIAELPPRVAAAQVAAVPIGAAGSFYSRYGDVFALGCLGTALVALARRRVGLLPH